MSNDALSVGIDKGCRVVWSDESPIVVDLGEVTISSWTESGEVVWMGGLMFSCYAEQVFLKFFNGLAVFDRVGRCCAVTRVFVWISTQ